MAKVKLAPEYQEIRGRLGNCVLRRAANGEMILSKMPDMSQVVWSPAQKAQRQRFKEAVAYAKAAMADSKICKVYEKLAKEKHKRPYDMAFSDYFKGRNLLRD